MERRTIEASAYHEAGHAVVAWSFGNPILKAGVAIDGKGAIGFISQLSVRRV